VRAWATRGGCGGERKHQDTPSPSSSSRDSLPQVTQVMAVPWELMGTGTEQARRKAVSLGRIRRRWAADGEGGSGCPVGLDLICFLGGSHG
jgi:hypothetical protein